MSDVAHTLRLEILSHLDRVDFVQLLSDHVGWVRNLDADATH